jgi:hypothetical protein
VLDRSLIGALTLAAALVLSGAAARAFDETKYPDLEGQWIRIGPGQYDPGKPPGAGQQPPLTPEYQAIFAANLADQAKGGQGDDPTYKCIPSGMPRAMMAIQPMEIVVTPGTAYGMIELFGMLRRIYADGRSRHLDAGAEGPAGSRFEILQVTNTDGRRPRRALLAAQWRKDDHA